MVERLWGSFRAGCRSLDRRWLKHKEVGRLAVQKPPNATRFTRFWTWWCLFVWFSAVCLLIKSVTLRITKQKNLVRSEKNDCRPLEELQTPCTTYLLCSPKCSLQIWRDGMTKRKDTHIQRFLDVSVKLKLYHHNSFLTLKLERTNWYTHSKQIKKNFQTEGSE